MDPRAEAIYAKAAEQIDTLVELAAGLDAADLRRPCPGRERLGDGSVGTVLAHTIDNYLRIAAFVAGAAVPAEGGHRHGHHGSAEIAGPDELRHRLTRARSDLGRIAELDDDALDSVPAAGTFRFCDGNRTVEQILAALLTHQGHQVEALGQR